MRRLSALAVLLACGITLAASTGPAAPPCGKGKHPPCPVTTTTAPTTTEAPDMPTPAHPQVGYASGDKLHSVSNALRAEEIANMAAAGATWVRFDLDWWAIEWADDTYDWSRWDGYLSEIKAAGMKPILMIGHTPSWARSGGGAWTPPTNNAKFGDFAAAAVARYANSTYNAYHYELWNEPNISAFWNVTGGPGGGGGVAKYVGMVQDAYPKMKAANPSVVVLAGATSPAVTNGTDIDPRDYIEACYAAGIGGYFDAWSHHPYIEANLPTEDYTWSSWSQMHRPQGFAAIDGAMTKPSLRETMAVNGDSSKELWATEANILADGTEGPTGQFATQARQAEVVDAMLTAWVGYDWAGGIMIYNYQGHGDWSMRNTDGSLRPVYDAYADWVAPVGAFTVGEVAVPRYRIEVGWEGPTAGLFTLGRSLLGGPDLLGGAWQLIDTPFDHPYADLTALEDERILTTEFQIVRGRSDPRGPVQEGSCRITVRDEHGILNPRNGTSPVFAHMTPMRPVRVTAILGSEEFVIFRGWLKEAQYDIDSRIATLLAADSIFVLSGRKPNVGVDAGATFSTIVGAVLTGSGVSLVDASLNDSAIAGALAPTGDRYATEVLSDIIAASQGMFYVSREGQYVLLARNDAVSRMSAGIFDASDSAVPGISVSGMVNMQTAQKEGSDSQSAVHDESRAQHGDFPGSDFSSPLFFNDAAALSWAEWEVDSKAFGSQPMWTFKPLPYVGNMEGMLGFDLGERVTANIPDVDSTDFSIQRIQHSGRAGQIHSVDWLLAEVPGAGAAPFIIGQSLIGGPNVLV